MNTPAKYPPTIAAPVESADNPNTVRAWRGIAYDLERHNATREHGRAIRKVFGKRITKTLLTRPA